MFRLDFWAAVFLGLALAGCGETQGIPTPPVEDWCDLDRPREDCELRGAEIFSRDDMAELCQSSCTAIGSLSIQTVDSEVLKGLGGFTQVRSLLLASLQEDVKDLSAINQVRAVNDLRIRANHGLENLNGVENIEFQSTCGDCPTNLVIENNSKLRSLAGLQNLTNLDSLEIKENPSLEVIEGMKSLRRTSIGIYGNPNLKRVSGFESLEEPRGISFTINYRLERIDAFQNVKRLEILKVDGNPALNMCDVDRILGQLEEPPRVVDVSELNGPPCAQ